MIVAALSSVTKRFGEIVALDEIQLELRSGEIVALLGPNGAGKTTALSILLGLRRPDHGSAALFGEDPHSPPIRSMIGVTSQDPGFPATLRVSELVAFVRAHFAAPTPSLDLLTRFGLSELAGRQAGGLSGGERRRLAVALAFAGRPRVVFLDEPTAGLDVEARRAVWAELRTYAAGGGTILLTTHYLEEAEALSSRVVMLARGRIVAEGSAAAIMAAAKTATLEEAFLALSESSR